MDFEATRSVGQEILTEFIPRMGPRYTRLRNFDRGKGAHRDVSLLSAYIRRRLITESEVVTAALNEHGPEASEKFIQEIFWRGYFKGWLERRPKTWDSYRDGLLRDLSTLDTDRHLRLKVEQAETGQTGLDYFDSWVEELIETGYLHNHARMWFASIWIFTLKLPWRIGADFFYRHLIDGDPASNTLGWRWVAGLHTRGKPYKAHAWNIAKFTEGRFSPREIDLASDITGLECTEPEGLPDVIPLRTPTPPEEHLPTALLITEDDCRLEEFSLQSLNICTAATVSASHLRSPRDVSSNIVSFEDTALKDSAARIGLEMTHIRACAPTDILRWANRSSVSQVVVPYVSTGPLGDWFEQTVRYLSEAGITLSELRRDWDAQIWPHATAGFFKVKKQIPRILHNDGLI